MLQNFDRVVMRIDRRCERFPFCFGRAYEFGPRRVSRNATIEPSQLKPQQPQISEQQNEDPQVSATCPDKPFSPFQLPRQLQTAAAPAFRQKIQFDRRRRQFDSDDLSGAGQNSLDRLAQFVAGLVQQNICDRKRLCLGVRHSIAVAAVRVGDDRRYVRSTAQG